MKPLRMLELALRRMGFSGEEIGTMTESEAEAYMECWKEMNRIGAERPQTMKVKRNARD